MEVWRSDYFSLICSFTYLFHNDTFQVKLITTSNYGCMDSLTKNRYVRANTVVAFTSPDTAECLKTNNFVITNTSTNASGTFNSLWKFGDGSTSTNTNPSHSYITANTFQIKLITTSSYGCIDSISKNRYVNPNPASAGNH